MLFLVKYFSNLSGETIWQRSLFNGKCQVILQAGKSNDIIKFEAISDGLQKGATGIHIIQPTTPEMVIRSTR